MLPYILFQVMLPALVIQATPIARPSLSDSTVVASSISLATDPSSTAGTSHDANVDDNKISWRKIKKGVGKASGTIVGGTGKVLGKVGGGIAHGAKCGVYVAQHGFVPCPHHPAQ